MKHQSLLILIFCILFFGYLGAQTSSEFITVDIQESIGECGLETDCVNSIICLDIVMTSSIDGELDSYNLWVDYNSDVISRKSLAANDNSGQGDASCIINDGFQDTDIEDSNAVDGKWRLSGVSDSGFSMIAGNPVNLHTICFEIIDEDALNGTDICVGGDKVFGLNKSTTTFTNAIYDDNITENCLTLNQDFTSCTILDPCAIELTPTFAISNTTFSEGDIVDGAFIVSNISDKDICNQAVVSITLASGSFGTELLGTTEMIDFNADGIDETPVDNLDWNFFPNGNVVFAQLKEGVELPAGGFSRIGLTFEVIGISSSSATTSLQIITNTAGDIDVNNNRAQGTLLIN